MNDANGRLEVEALVDQAFDYNLEFAFYLKVDGAVAMTSMYSKERTAEFTRPRSGKKFWVQAFARRPRGDRQPYVINSPRFDI